MSCVRIYYHLPLGHLNTYRNKRTNVVTSFSSWGISEKKDPRDLSCPLENLRLNLLIASLITFVFEYSWHQPATSSLKSRSTWTLLYQCSSRQYLHRFASISHLFHIFLSFSCEMNNPTIGFHEFFFVGFWFFTVIIIVMLLIPNKRPACPCMVQSDKRNACLALIKSKDVVNQKDWSVRTLMRC